MRDHRNAVEAFRDDHVGFLEGLVGIAGHLLAGSLGAWPGLRQIVFLDQVRHHLIFHLDLAHGVARHLFRGRGDGRDLRAFPLNLRSGGRDHVNGRDARHRFRFADIDLDDLRDARAARSAAPRTADPCG